MTTLQVMSSVDERGQRHVSLRPADQVSSFRPATNRRQRLFRSRKSDSPIPRRLGSDDLLALAYTLKDAGYRFIDIKFVDSHLVESDSEASNDLKEKFTELLQIEFDSPESFVSAARSLIRPLLVLRIKMRRNGRPSIEVAQQGLVHAALEDLESLSSALLAVS